MWRGRRGRRRERWNGSLVVRCEVLRVGPKHGLILQSQSGRQTHTRIWEGNRQEKKWLGQQWWSSDRLFTVSPAWDSPSGHPPSPGVSPLALLPEGAGWRLESGQGQSREQGMAPRGPRRPAGTYRARTPAHMFCWGSRDNHTMEPQGHSQYHLLLLKILHRSLALLLENQTLQS